MADNGTDKATIYPGFVNGSPIQKAPLVVNMPGGAPTGQVFNATPGSRSAPERPAARRCSCSTPRRGWSPAGTPACPRRRPRPRRRSAPACAHAIYKGLAIATTSAGTFLYAADFHHARIDVFDQGFDRVHLSGSFRDRKLPHGYAPFNIQELGGRLYVAYAKQDADREDEVAGPGRGFVDVYSTSGHLLRRLVRRGH